MKLIYQNPVTIHWSSPNLTSAICGANRDKHNWMETVHARFLVQQHEVGGWSLCDSCALLVLEAVP